jgi:glycosyltransferase involved in cell wall biosynthesis
MLSRWKYRHPATDHYICLTEAIATVLGRTVSRQMSVIPSGVDRRVFEPWRDPAARQAARAWLRKQLGVGPDTVVVLNAAALAGHKDLPTFLRVAARFRQESRSMAWVVAGADAGEGAQLRLLIESTGLADTVWLLGFRRDVPKIMAGSDLFLFTSRMEGMGSVLLEAFASRLPVVTTDAGGITAVVRHGRNGWVAPVGDEAALAGAVRLLLDDADLRERLSAQAIRDLSEFSTEKMSERVLEVYEAVRPFGST